MRSCFFSFTAALILISTALFNSCAKSGGTTEKIKPDSIVSGAIIPFVENVGQAKLDVLFYASVPGGSASVAMDGSIAYLFSGANVKESFTGLDKAQIKPVNKSETVVNYYFGNEKNKWKEGIKTWNGVSMGKIAKGIELKLTAHMKNIEKIFTVSPGADPNDINSIVSGAERVSIDENGKLVFETINGDIEFTRPIAYQTINGKKKEIKVSYKLNDFGYGFYLGDYDKSKELIIDPLVASTVRGGSGNDDAVSMAIDASGNVFVAGMTMSANFPKTNSSTYNTNNAKSDCFIMKLNSALTTVSVATYFGGGSDDCRYTTADSWTNLDLLYGASLGITSTGIYLAGNTYSSDFPSITGGYDTKCGTDSGGTCNSSAGGTTYSDITVSKFNADLQLQASTFLGGSNNEYGAAIAATSNGIFVAGRTASTNYPVTNSSTSGGSASDAVVAKFNNDLTTLQASTYLGGNGLDRAYAITVSGTSVLVTGITGSTNFPVTAGVYKNTIGKSGTESGNGDVFISKLSATDLSNTASTFFGGAYSDFGNAIAVDSQGKIFIGGSTYSNKTADGFPVNTNSYKQTITSNSGGTWYSQGFVAKFSSDLVTLEAVTYVGGDGGAHDDVRALWIDTDNSIFAAGFTSSTDLNTTAGVYSTAKSSGFDGFISHLSADLKNLVASTFIGGNGDDRIMALTQDEANRLVAAGFTASSNFPDTNNTKSGGNDLFVFKIYKNLKTTAVGAVMEINPATNDFGSISVGSSSSTLEVSVKNRGDASMMITNATATDTTNFAFNPMAGSKPCGASTVSPNDYCTATIAFTPTTAGTKSCDINVTSNAINTPQTASYTGTGAAVVPDLDGLIDNDVTVPDTIVVPDNDITVPDTVVNPDFDSGPIDDIIPSDDDTQIIADDGNILNDDIVTTDDVITPDNVVISDEVVISDSDTIAQTDSDKISGDIDSIKKDGDTIASADGDTVASSDSDNSILTDDDTSNNNGQVTSDTDKIALKRVTSGCGCDLVF